MAGVRRKTVFADRRFTITAVESLEFHADRTNHRCFIAGGLKPVAVIVREMDKTYAFDMDAGPVDIDQLNLPADFELE
mgnify:CR=1 FL=1